MSILVPSSIAPAPSASPGGKAPARAVEPLDQRGVDLRLRLAADAATCELGRNHPCVIDHELVAGPQPVRQVGDRPVLQRGARLHHQQPR